MVRTGSGLVVPGAVLVRPNFIRLMSENNAHLRRMFAHLARLGVIAEWEQAFGSRAASA
jgi:hypothetical protein